MPLFSTPTQFAVLALLLVAGWLFGLASHPGGAKWKARYAAERDAHAANRKEADARIAAAKSNVDERHNAMAARVTELERENERLRRAAPVTAATVAPREPMPMAFSDRQPVARSAASPAYPAGERRGWFDWSNRTPTNG